MNEDAMPESVQAAPPPPPPMTTMESRDIYIKLTDPTGKHKPVVNAHRVWDGARFIDSQHKQYERDAKPEDRRTVTEATRAEYQAGR